MKIQFPRSYVVYDFETTGLDTNVCEVAEVAAIRFIDGVKDQEFSMLLKVEGEMSPEASAVTGITKEMTDAEGRPPIEGMTRLVELCSHRFRQLPLVGHNILRYDNIILARMLEKLGVTIDQHPDLQLWSSIRNCVDTAALYKAEKMGKAWNPAEQSFLEYQVAALDERVPGLKYKLGLACAEMNIDNAGLVAHRALADVEMCARLYQRLTV